MHALWESERNHVYSLGWSAFHIIHNHIWWQWFPYKLISKDQKVMSPWMLGMVITLGWQKRWGNGMDTYHYMMWAQTISFSTSVILSVGSLVFFASLCLCHCPYLFRQRTHEIYFCGIMLLHISPSFLPVSTSCPHLPLFLSPPVHYPSLFPSPPVVPHLPLFLSPSVIPHLTFFSSAPRYLVPLRWAAKLPHFCPTSIFMGNQIFWQKGLSKVPTI